MSRVTPINPALMYPRDASFWRSPSVSSAHAYHRPSQTNEGWAACSSRILLASEWGTNPETVDELSLRCRRPACAAPPTPQP